MRSSLLIQVKAFHSNDVQLKTSSFASTILWWLAACCHLFPTNPIIICPIVGSNTHLCSKISARCCIYTSDFNLRINFIELQNPRVFSRRVLANHWPRRSPRDPGIQNLQLFETICCSVQMQVRNVSVSESLVEFTLVHPILSRQVILTRMRSLSNAIFYHLPSGTP